MRNAPLLKAIAKHPNANIVSGWDERAHSYRALGYIKTKGGPAALVCTSGTAVANFLPAVIEARKTHAPLIVLSADRPGELNATDANQTINQVEVLRDYCKEFWNISEPQETFPARALTGKVSFLIHKTLQRPRGPLHLNIPLREPLDDTPKEIGKEWQENAQAILNSPVNSIEYPETQIEPAHHSIEKLAKTIIAAKNPLVVFGPLHGPKNYEKSEVQSFLKHYQANFSFDVTTGLKFDYGTDDGLIPTLDHPEVQNQLEGNAPDLILHFGHRLTSKHYYGLIQRLQTKGETKEIIHIGAGHFHEDPGFSFTSQWDLDPKLVLKALTQTLSKQGEVTRELFSWNDLIKKKRTIIEEGALSYPFITKRAVDTLSSAKQAFLGNSTFIRSFDSYAGTYAPDSSWQCITHRGASGIEGHLSSALGMLEANPTHPTLLFVGDVSFIHDLNALVSLAEQTNADTPLLVVLANNNRGGIFNLLPLAQKEESKEYLDYLTTPHKQVFSKVFEALQIEHRTITNKDTYQEALDSWNKNPKRLILEVIFNDEDNAKVYKELKTVRL